MCLYNHKTTNNGWTKGHFTLQPSVKLTKDSSNLIDGEQNFVHSAFTLNTNGLQNTYMATLSENFGAKILSSGRKLVCNIFGNLNSP
jgi:hypothetical protein